jgi:hypothetical protein
MTTDYIKVLEWAQIIAGGVWISLGLMIAVTKIFHKIKTNKEGF